MSGAMSGSFNAQILIDKLAKLNSTQQSIETLSHWCIFHRTKAKQVVETWDLQFHHSPRDQRVPYLYLANDILQNSRRKCSDFVVEFWKVLPDALNDVIENGGEFERNAALRLVDIWEERKVFGSRGQNLKEEFLRRKLENHSSVPKDRVVRIQTALASKQLRGNLLEKLESNFEHVYDGSLNEEAALDTCQSAINSVQKLEDELRNDPGSGATSKSEIIQELQGHDEILRGCIEKLKAVESARAVLISNLKEALEDQVFKLQQVQDKLQVAQARSELASNICEQLRIKNTEQSQKEVTLFPATPPCFPESQPATGEKDNSIPVTYSQGGRIPDFPIRTGDDNIKTTAAAMAAKLAASTSSAEMLSSLLSSLASEGVISHQTREDHSSDGNKRIKLDNGIPYIPQQPPPPSQFPHPDSLMKIVPSQPPVPQTSSFLLHPVTTMQPLQRPMSLPPLQPPLPPNQLTQAAGSTTSIPYSYGSTSLYPHLQPVYTSSSIQSYPVPPNGYQNLPVTEVGTSLSQPQLHAIVPSMSRQ